MSSVPTSTSHAMATENAALKVRILSVCDAVGDFIEYWGFKAIHGRIWTLLALRSQPTSQSELAEQLGVSRSLVSTVIAELTEHGLVQPTSTHRNAPYEAVMDVWPTIADVLRNREWLLLEKARNALEAALEEVDLSGSPGPYNAARLRLLLSMTELAQKLVKGLISIRIPRTIESVVEWMPQAAAFLQSLRR